MADGKIVQCIGAVVEVEFPRNAMPKVYDALKMEVPRCGRFSQHTASGIRIIRHTHRPPSCCDTIHMGLSR